MYIFTETLHNTFAKGFSSPWFKYFLPHWHYKQVIIKCRAKLINLLGITVHIRWLISDKNT